MKRYRLKDSSPLKTLIVQVNLSVGAWESPSVEINHEGVDTEYDLDSHLTRSFFGNHIEKVQIEKVQIEKQKVQSIAQKPVVIVESPEVPVEETKDSDKQELIEEENEKSKEVEVKINSKKPGTKPTINRSNRR